MRDATPQKHGASGRETRDFCIMMITVWRLASCEVAAGQPSTSNLLAITHVDPIIQRDRYEIDKESMTLDGADP